MTDHALDAGSPFPLFAAAWLDDVEHDVDRSQGTKETYKRQLETLVLHFFEHFTIREVSVGRVERYLKQQREKSYTQAKHSRTILGMIMAFTVRREITARNLVKEASRMKNPPHTPKALTTEHLAAIRLEAHAWRSQECMIGPRSDGQVRDIIEVMLATATRIGELLALRQRDVDLDADPPQVSVSGTIVVHNGAAVHRQEHPMTHESHRIIPVPEFAADVMRERLALLDSDEPEHLLFFSRNNTPLTPYNVRRTFRGILLAAGLGDKTQFLAFALSARTAAPVLAAIGATLGVLAAAVPAAMLGRRFVTVMPLRAVRIGIGVVFILVALGFGLDALRLL